jgi:hypothetical protein
MSVWHKQGERTSSVWTWECTMVYNWLMLSLTLSKWSPTTLKMLNLKDRKKNTLIQDSLLYDKCRVLKKSEDKFLTKGQPAYKR